MHHDYDLLYDFNSANILLFKIIINCRFSTNDNKIKHFIHRQYRSFTGVFNILLNIVH